MDRRMFLQALSGVGVCAALAAGRSRGGRYTPMVESHLRAVMESGTDVYGPVMTGMWVASMDTRTREHVLDNKPRRVYRLIGAPNGSTLYWDQPLVVAAFEVSRLTGDGRYAKGAEAYTKAFLECCVKDDMFEWGNHKYYDVMKDEVIGFSGSYHELRPITPAWELFWRYGRRQCERYIRKMCELHVFDKETGGFNRHDNQKREHAFIEAGGILAESAAWLYSKRRDEELLEIALRIGQYSYDHRGEKTGLIVNEPDKGRWDSKVATTEVGVWARSLLRAHEYTGNGEFLKMAAEGVRAYLMYGFDEEAGRYYGQVDVKTGEHVKPKEKGYWPGEYSDVFNSDQWPTHDYPMGLATACVRLADITGEGVFGEGVRRWVKVVEESLPGPTKRVVYAEQYGRCVDFLLRAGRYLGDEAVADKARMVADEAVERLYENGVFQGYPGGHLYESVDGVGSLCLALLSLENPGRVKSYGLG